MILDVFLVLVFLMLMMLMLQKQWVRSQQKKVTKHDQILFPFCQLRRDIMTFLHENVIEKSALSHEEYISVRRLSEALDGAIHDYEHRKNLLFNLRKVMKYFRQYRHTLKKAGPLELTTNPEIQKFHKRFVLCMAMACFAYTPLIRSELLLSVVALKLRASYRRYIFMVAKEVRDSIQDGNSANVWRAA